MNIEELSPQEDGFAIVQSDMNWLRLPMWESIFSLSNGVIGVRGSFEEAMEGIHTRPMTFMAGLYNTLPGGLPELPLLPDWLTTRIVLDGSPFDLRLGWTKRFTRWLDMRRGVLARQVRWQDYKGRTTELAFLRFASLADRSLCVLRICLTPLDWSGVIEVETALTMPPVPPGRGRPSSRSHWGRARLRSKADGLCRLETRTRQTRRSLAVASAYEARTNGQPLVSEAHTYSHLAGPAYRIEAKQGETYEFDRYVIYLAGDADAKPLTKQARNAAAAARSQGLEALLDRHAAACADMWDRIDVEIDGADDDQRAVRFNLFQLATLGPRPGDFASIGPKGLSSAHYRGHIFWDTEIYMIPFFALTDPEAARTLLTYRYKTLDGARRKAKSRGHRGAQYAWESADTGDETCPRYVPDPHGGEPIRVWCGELQDHITADVPYAIDRYVRASGDNDFLWDFGAEITFETARFWTSRVSLDDSGQHSILEAMGPDEHHVHVDNDAFTNYLAHWNLLAAAELYDNPAFPRAKREALIEKLSLRPDEPKAWREIAAKLKLAYNQETGFINQSDGFTDRPEVSPDIMRIKRRVPITDLVGMGLTVEAQVLKQAEVVMLQYLLEDRFDTKSREVNFDYYEPRTSHDSSLSVSSHALAAARLGRVDQAYDYFRRAVNLDLHDLAGNTGGGVHTANMGGVWLAVAFGFAGLSIDGPAPTANPRLPANWKRLRLNITHRGQRYVVDCAADKAIVQRK